MDYVVWVPANTANTAVAVGPFGSDFTTDGGRTWHRFDETSLRGIDSLPTRSSGGGAHPDPGSGEDAITCWAVGENGTVAKLVITSV